MLESSKATSIVSHSAIVIVVIIIVVIVIIVIIIIVTTATATVITITSAVTVAAMWCLHDFCWRPTVSYIIIYSSIWLIAVELLGLSLRAFLNSGLRGAVGMVNGCFRPCNEIMRLMTEEIDAE